MLVKNLTQNTEWDDVALDVCPTLLGTWGYDEYWFENCVKVGDIILVEGFFYFGTKHELPNSWVKCQRISPLEACEVLENQRNKL